MICYFSEIMVTRTVVRAYVLGLGVGVFGLLWNPDMAIDGKMVGKL
jgi:hypothetical protein